ncbi:MAG: hypothetical protein NTY32_03300 [Bacteroidia bacterium]|nr:hypothetical protein [Bacteroidia bacterium]
MKTKKSTFFTAALVALTLVTPAMAQENAGTVSYSDVEQLQSDNALAKRLKITGYIQTQFQKADTAGIASFAGGDFTSGIDNRIAVRRGRVKFLYDNENAQAVVQFDITEKGLGIKDVYLTVLEPWLNTVSLTGGVFDRPFGYEISYSSSARETPERSRLFQTLFPGERDLGGRLTIQAPKTSNWNFLKLDLGLINGNGTNVETDKYKDLVGHLSATKSSADEKFKWGLGASFYKGGFAYTTTNLYTMKKTGAEKGFILETVKKGNQALRQYLGLDAQLSYDWALGITQFRGEFLMGTQPGTSTSSSSLTAANASAVSTASLTTGAVTSSNVGKDVYSRPFAGYYAYLIQNILETPLQAVVKYDVYDPNTIVSGNEIAKAVTAGVKTGSADVKYSTLGIGLNYRWSSNVKFLAYYDIVRNETTSNIVKASTLEDLSHDRNDNVFTFRVQYKF